jgi:hypothetical protein
MGTGEANSCAMQRPHNADLLPKMQESFLEVSPWTRHNQNNSFRNILFIAEFNALNSLCEVSRQGWG